MAWRKMIETRARFDSSTGVRLKDEVSEFIYDDTRLVAVMSTYNKVDGDIDLIVGAPTMLSALEYVLNDLLEAGEMADAKQLTIVSNAIAIAKGKV